MKNSRKNAAYRLILCAAAAAAVCTGASYASCQNATSAPSAQGSAAVRQMKAAKHMPAIRILDAVSDGTTADVRITVTPLTSATGKKGTLDEIRVNTNRISFRYTLPDYLEPSAQWDTDWKEYVYGTPKVTVTFADGSETQLKLTELYGEQDAQNFDCYTHYFTLRDGIQLKNAVSLTVNGTQYTLR